MTTNQIIKVRFVKFKVVLQIQNISSIITFFVLEYSDNFSSLGIPGTRQTLYLSGEENVS